MKNISKILAILFLTSLGFSSCDDMLSVDSDRFISAQDHDMTGANDTLYSMFGVYSQLQKLADGYVLLGELRADLMDVTDSADIYLKEIYNHDISADNPYVQLKDYYAVINNCNYIIHNIDTMVLSNEKGMLKTYAAAKGARAWTYMQIALNFGKVTYYDKPILTVDQAKASYPEYTMEQLAPVLIEDIEPFKNVIFPNFGDTYGQMYLFFPIHYLLGDLYLWMGAYSNDNQYNEKAANEYRNLIFKESYVISYRSTYGTANNAFNGDYQAYWSFNYPEIITTLASSNQFGYNFKLDTLTMNLSVAASQKSIDYWGAQHYVHSLTLDTLGDLRMKVSVGRYSYIDDSNVTTNLTGRYMVTKFTNLNYGNDKKTPKYVPVYRASQLYLRYAEAVNRMGKPNLAMAVMKYGLNAATLSNRKYIPANETDSILPNYMDFRDLRFSQNIGIHAHGCGNTQLDTTFYRIPDFKLATTPKQDSIVYVEDLIQKELALELAFEGHRFHDLMRFSIRRNDNSYIANIVSAKYDNPEAIKTKLLDRTNWYLKK